MEQKNSQPDKEERSDSSNGNYMSMGMSIGLCLGVAMGRFVFDNLSMGLAVGLCLGISIGACIKKKDRK